ncbi:conserved Plasmodium protein, unknown function [Plasmodium yoelii]|uniref:U3 small nucleolar RNA-associated protein 20 domain-containing protein n=3 Tax=Plasmodium yoelii TaxID=5861 RepID=A0AAE9WKZ3_PLAYO|nr:conserved Plasmodium protein, unknown function [Plasmodium yoelii]WBY55957.1 hypothetical protein Py17XNL_000600646 [Plasmodium yoelii yoelii]CDU16945.1 conserved Plasmodium protein, unknown function [Plasmodium yoelii]VTZ75264.1 conserved Plasmodium protein, unknown function [Plasmodium yoelii]|eukprot:XP_022813147.1 conserved Plasmodium protein, unknown function [Plasmodium yoelii]
MKRSLKYIKLKIKKEGKKGHFVSFYDRIKEINEKEKLQTYNLLEDSNYYNSSKSYKPNNENDVDEDLKNTNFHAALQEYYKNCCNPEFRRCCRELFPLSKNLILILLNKDTIFSIILKYIENSKIRNDESYFYKLLVILIKDLKNESKKYLEDILKTLFRKINFNNLDLLEEIFSSYANIFRIMNKNIIKNVDKYIKISLPLFQHRNSIIKIFIADSFSYLLRKLSLHDLILCFSKLYSFFNNVMKNKLKHYSETISLLMLESLKVDNDKLSKKTLPFLKYIIHSIYLRKQYDCIETGNVYNPLDNINGVIQHIHKAIQLFFIDIYNFTKKGSFEFWDIFLTYILQNYSTLYESYFNRILTSNNKDAIIDILTDADKYSYFMKCLEKNEKDNEGISPKCEENFSEYENSNLKMEKKNNCTIEKENHKSYEDKIRYDNFDVNSNIKKDIIFIKDIFYDATNFFLKNILNIWIQKNHEKKNIIIETIRLELKKYADKLNNIELNYLTFIYTWNLYDNIFFILNYDSIDNEKISNIYISFVHIFMGILKWNNEDANKNNYTNYLLQFFIIKVVNILKKNVLNHNEVYLNNFFKYIFIRIMQILKLNNIYGYSKNQSLITSNTPFMLSFKNNVEKETQFILNNIVSSENNNLILAKLFLLCDIIKMFKNKTTEINVDCIENLDFLCDSGIKDIKNNNTEKKRKHNMLENDYYSQNDNDFKCALNGEGIYNSNKSKIFCLNPKIDNHEINLDFKNTSPKEIYMQIEDFVVYIFDEIKKLLIILKYINQYGNDENNSSQFIFSEDNENPTKENVGTYLKSTIYFMFAFINFLSQISATYSNALLILNDKTNKNDKDICLTEENDCIRILFEICNVLEEIKCGKFMQNNILEKNTSDIRSNVNSIIIDIHLIITALQISSQENNINIKLSNNNIPFLVNYINNWGMEDIYYCDKYLHKFQNIFINLYKLNYFENRLDDIFLYLKFFEKVLIYYETINKQKLLRVIKMLVAIYINLKKNKDINGMVENEYILKKTNEHYYGKILLLFDNFIYLENKEYLSTHIQIYESKIVDIVSFLNFLKNVDIFKNYIFKMCTKICIIELTMLLNAKLSIIPKYIISNLKKFFETYNADHKIQDAMQNNYQSKYYFYIIKNIYKTTRKKLNIFEELIEKNYISYEEFINSSRQPNDYTINYNDEHDMKEEKENINEEFYIDENNYMPIINTNEYEHHLEQYVCENKNNDTFKFLYFENFNIQNFVRNILCSFDLLIVPVQNNNNLNKSDRIELLNMYIWIITYVNIKCNYYIHEYKCYKLIDIIFDIVSNMNNIFPDSVENIFNITKKNIYNELTNIHTKSIPDLIGLIKYFIKIFVSNFTYNANILNVENMSKFVKILCSYNKELNNYKNDIEEILLDKNINFTKLILNIKEEDNSNIIRILIKIIFWLLKNKKGKGGFKRQKNIIFYLSSIPDEQNWCHIFLPIIYSFTNVYKNCIKYDNLVRHEEKENTLLEFLTTYQGKFFQCWNYDFDIKMRNNNIQNGDNENADFSYDSIFNYSYWNFNNHIIEIKKELFKNAGFRRNFQLFIDMLKIIKYKLSPYFEFFLHIFITISHYINAYLYIKKKIKTAKNIRLCIKQIDNSKYMNSLLSVDQTVFESGSKIVAPISSENINNNGSDSVSGNNNEYELSMGSVIDKIDKMETECPDFKEAFVDLTIPNSFLKNINKKCIESSQFIMENADISECNLVKAKNLFVFLFKKNLKSLKAKNIFLNILFNTWCKNEAYYNFYNTVVPNSIYLLIKAVNSKEIVKKLTFTEWEQITEKVFNIILRLCGYDTDEQEYEEKVKSEKKHTKKYQDKHKIVLNPLVASKSNHNRLFTSFGFKILKPYIPDIILCIKKSILKRYQNFLQKKNNETSFIKKRKMKEFKIISNKELYILIELSSINKNQIYNIHVINTISTFMLANPKTLHSTKDHDINKIKLTLIALKILIINLSKNMNNLTKRKKNNYNFSYQRYSSKNVIEEYINKLREKDNQNNDKKNSYRNNTNAHISESSFYYNSYKIYICYKLKTVLYEIIQRCYDLDCRILSGELLIMIGCIFLKIKNIEKYLKLFKKNTDKFLAKTNDLNYNSKTILRYIMKIPLKNIKTIKQNKHYTFLQIAQIYSSLNLCNERSTNEYDSDIQFLILLDLCNIKMSSIKNNYLIRENANIEQDSNKNDYGLKQINANDKEENKLDIIMPESFNVDVKEHNKMKLEKKLYTFNDLFLNSNKMFLEILIRHCLFLIFNNNTNEMVVDKSIKFILLFTKILRYLLQLYKNKNAGEAKNKINSQNERICYDHIKRDIQIYVHFVINIIIPKALNALKKNSDNFTKISLQIILTLSKNVCPYISVLKSLNIGKFLKDIKDSYIKKHELNEETNSLFSFDTLRKENEKNIYEDNNTTYNCQKMKKHDEISFKSVEKFLFYDLYYYINSKQREDNDNDKITKLKDNVQDKSASIIQNIIDIKSENNLEGIKKMITVAHNLCYYTICKIIIPISLNYILQRNSKKETFNKNLSLNSIKLLGVCSEKIGIKNVYDILELLLLELKNKSFNNLYIEKAISHLLRAYHFNEFKEDSFVNKINQNNDKQEGENEEENEEGKQSSDKEQTNDKIPDEDKKVYTNEENEDICNNNSYDTQILNKSSDKPGQGKKNLYCQKFNNKIIPQLRSLMFEKPLSNNPKDKKTYINDLVTDYKNKDVLAKPNIILSFLVILNKINYNFDKELNRIIYKLCFCLSSVKNNIRSESKKALCNISMYLGLNYIDLIIAQMSDYLTKGYHIPVFLCTVNSILESVLYEKDKFLDKNCLKINFNVITELDISKRNHASNSGSYAHNNKRRKTSRNKNYEIEKRDTGNCYTKNEKLIEDNFLYSNICKNIFNMIKLEIINDIEKNTEDVNKKKIKRKTKESQKNYGNNIIKLLAIIMPGTCIENNILTFLESLFSGESFENNEVDKNFILKKKYIHIVSSYFNDFIKGIEENKNISPKFILNIIYKLLIKSTYFFKGDIYENLIDVMKNTNVLYFKYNLDNEITGYNHFKKTLQFYLSKQKPQDKFLGYNYNMKYIQYPEKKRNLDIIEGSFQEKNIYDSFCKTKKYDFKVHAQILAKVALKLLLFIIKKLSRFVTAQRLNLNNPMQGQPNSLIHSSINNINNSNNIENVKNIQNYTNLNGERNRTNNYIQSCESEETKLGPSSVGEEKEDTTISMEKIDSKMTLENNYGIVEFIHLIEPLLVYCYCYGKDDVFIMSSNCIKLIKKKKYSNFNKFGKLIILSSVDILKNIPNYYSKEFDRLILSCIDTLTYIIKSNNNDDIISWLNYDTSNRGISNNTNENNSSMNDNNIPSKKRKMKQGKHIIENDMDEYKIKRQRKISYILDENIISTYYKNDYEENYEESINSLRYCLIDQISLLLESKNHIRELLLLFKNCLLREDVNNIIKKGIIVLKINSCIDQIFTIMIEESHDLKLSFLCGQIYINFLMSFPISKGEKKKKVFEILNNLDDENDDSRIAVLNSLYLFLNRSNAKLLKDGFYYIIFTSLLVNFSKETNPKCKKMYVFLLSLLFQQIDDINYVFNSYKILKNNLAFSIKSPTIYTYLYLLPVFASFFYKNISEYNRKISITILEENEIPPLTKEKKKNRQKQIKQDMKQVEEQDHNHIQEKDQNDNNEQNNLQNSLVTVRNYFLEELLKYANNDLNRNKMSAKEKTERENNNKIKLNNANSGVFFKQNCNIVFMKNQLEDLFLSLMFYLIEQTYPNMKLYMKEDKNCINILTSNENITYFSRKHYLYKENVNKDIVHLFYSTLEQIFTYIDTNLIEKLLNKKYLHEKYQGYFINNERNNFTNMNEIDNNEKNNFHFDKDQTHDKLIIYFLYFWNLLFENALYNKNPFIQIISLKIVMNYINKKMSYPFFPLLLVKLYSTDKFIINIIIKRVLSLVLNSYFLEHFYTYHKEISVLLLNICKLVVLFPWITNGFEEQNNQNDALNQGTNTIDTINRDNLFKTCKKNHENDLEQNNIHKNNVNQYDHPNKNSNNHFKKSNSDDDDDNKSNEDEVDDEEFKEINGILQNENYIKVHSFSQHNYQNKDERNEIKDEIKINKEILSYSKFFLIIITLSRAISLHLINNKKSFTRILTILNVYKNIIQDFPIDLWNPDNGIIHNVITPLYKLASLRKKKHFTEDSTIFEETSSDKKLTYLSNFSWDIISLLEEKLQDKKHIFNKAFIQARHSVNRIRFMKKRRKNILAVKNPKLYTSILLNRREKKKEKKKSQIKILS